MTFRVKAIFLDLARVNNVDNVRDSDRGFGDVGGEDDLASVAAWRGEEGLLLLFGRDGGVQCVDYVGACCGVAREEGVHAADFGEAGEEDEDGEGKFVRTLASRFCRTKE